jgi:transmembrane sensor
MADRPLPSRRATEQTPPTVDTISEIAARWAVRADAGNLGPDEERELDSWLAADPRHLGAYVRARAQWVDLDRLTALRGLAPGPEHLSATSTFAAMAAPHCPRRRLLLAAMAGAGVLGGLSWAMLYTGPERYASGIGEMRRIALADGSVLLLNTDSEVFVRLTKQQREIQLVRGEALFEVAHDQSRPFVVLANVARVRAVGTAFAVRIQGTRVEVTVTEGVVEVADPVVTTPLDARVRRVAAHERAFIASAQPPKVEAVATGEVERQFAWREGRVSFEGESLQTAVAEINRHNRRQIVVTDPKLASMPIIGVFRTTDLQGFAAAAAAALNARVIAEGDIIRLQPEGGGH